MHKRPSTERPTSKDPSCAQKTHCMRAVGNEAEIGAQVIIPAFRDLIQCAILNVPKGIMMCIHMQACEW